ncbi:DUF4135 domain-containing protein [Arachnia propionica]|nr:DUF4135 domain-containing protein [Arachnia propionica]
MNSLATPSWFDHISDTYPDIIRLGNSITQQIEHAHLVSAEVTRIPLPVESALNLTEGFQITDIEPVGDVHPGGLCTLLFSTHTDKKFLFKASSPENVLFVANLTELVNERLDYPLYVPHSVPTGFNGHYQEYVEHAERQHSLSEYYKFGAWLAIADCVSFTDLHMENVIPTPHGPCIIDFECFPTPEIAIKELRSTLPLLNRSGILPAPFTLADKEDTVDWSAIGGDSDQLSPSWAMHEVLEDGLPTFHLGRASKDSARRPSPQTRMSLSRKAEHSLMKGFLDAHRAMSAAGKDKVLSLTELNSPKPRLVLRPTQIYHNCLRRSSYPRYLSDPEARKNELRNWLINGLFPESLIEHELEPLRDFFIPLFQVDLSAKDVDGLEILPPATILQKSISRHLDAMRPNQALRQIRQVFEVQRKQSEPMQRVSFSAPRLPAPSAAERIRIIEHLAESIISCAEEDSFGYSWSNIQRDQEGNWVQTSYSPSLYHGSAGIYLALNSALLSGARISSYGIKLLKGLKDQLTDFLMDPPEILPLGLFEGAAGVAYSLIASKTPETNSDLIISALARILEDRVYSMSHDIISGAAGVLLFADRLERMGISSETATVIQSWMCRQLKNLAHESEDGIWVWETNSDWFGGLSHGPAGVMWALRESCYSRFFSDLAEKALEAQMSLLRADDFSWRSRRLSDSPPICAWCHGNEGLALVFSETDPDSVLAKQCVNSLIKQALPSDVCLCHGISGRYLSLHTLNLHDAAAQASTLLWRHASTKIDMMENLDDSLMTGRAGVLLSLSHSLASRVVPSPLTAQILEAR